MKGSSGLACRQLTPTSSNPNSQPYLSLLPSFLTCWQFFQLLLPVFLCFRYSSFENIHRRLHDLCDVMICGAVRLFIINSELFPFDVAVKIRCICNQNMTLTFFVPVNEKLHFFFIHKTWRMNRNHYRYVKMIPFL